MSDLPATAIARRSGWWSVYVPVLLVNLLVIGRVDQSAVDDRECKAKGFNVNA